MKLKIIFICLLFLCSCGRNKSGSQAQDSSPQTQSDSYQSDNLYEKHYNGCRFEGESTSTSLEEHFELIKQNLAGSGLSKYFMSCGAFLGNDRYYDDLLSPAAKNTLSEIRENKAFKSLAYNALLTAIKNKIDPSEDLIDVNSNWRNDDDVSSVLISLLRSPIFEIRSSAAGALKGTSSDVAISKLLKMLKSANRTERLYAVFSLEGTKVPRARKAMIEMRNDPDEGIRASAIMGTL